MIGVIIGDIVGTHLEHNIPTTYKNDFIHYFNNSKFTDDTVTSLAIAKSILECHNNYQDLDKITIKNLKELGRKYIDRDFGSFFIKWILSDNSKPYNSFANGGAMRVSACAYAAYNLETLKDLVYKVTAITHNHKEGLKGALAIASCIFLLRIGKSKDFVLNYIQKNFYNLNYELKDIHKLIPNLNTSKAEITVPLAILAFKHAKSFNEVLENTSFIGGDLDTISAMSCSMAEVLYKVPKELRAKALDLLTPDLKTILFEFENKFIQ